MVFHASDGGSIASSGESGLTPKHLVMVLPSPTCHLRFPLAQLARPLECLRLQVRTLLEDAAEAFVEDGVSPNKTRLLDEPE